MRCRYIFPKTGQEVTLCQPENSYSLPEGFQPGSKARYIRYDYGSVTVEQNGKTWRMAMQCLEYEIEYEVKDRWHRRLQCHSDCSLVDPV